MYKVCDSELRILSEWSSLAMAKAVANSRATEYRNRTFFVFDHTGQCVAGYTVA